MGSIAVKNINDSAAKFARNAANASGDYGAATAAAGARWNAAISDPTTAENYANGVTASIARGAYQKGAKRATGEYYAQRASTIGQRRFQEGVREGQGNWSEGFQPFADTLSRVTLPPKGIRGSSQNYDRVRAVGEALRAQKEGRPA